MSDLARYRPFALSLAIFAADRAAKFWIESNVPFWRVIPVIPGFFQIVHTRNRGIAFGIFNDDAGARAYWLLVALTVGILGFVATLLWRYTRPGCNEHWTLRYALVSVFGGALGNFYDRLLFESVTDFLDFYWRAWHFPVFNLADAAITVGAGLLILNLTFVKPPAPASPPDQP